MSEIRDIELWESGKLKIEWVRNNMSLLRSIEEEFERDKNSMTQQEQDKKESSLKQNENLNFLRVAG